MAVASFAQTTWNFSTPASLSGSPWLNYATVTIGGVQYKIGGGINGNLSNQTSGGNGNSACLKKMGSGGESLTISRVDGKRFQFYGLWLKQVSYPTYPNTPPFYTIRFNNGSTQLKSYVVNTSTSTVTYNENLGVTSVSVMFNAIDYYFIDDLIVGPAIPATDASLASLSINKGTLNPAFSATTYSYSASVGYGTSTLNVTPKATDNLGATIKVNGVTTASNTAAAVPLNLGNNTITVEVTAEDGTTKKTYTLVVNRSSTPDYCQPGGNCHEYDDDVNSFTLAAEDGTSLNDANTGCAGASAYSLRTPASMPKLQAGKSYAATLTTSAAQWSNTDGEHFKVWIDFNDNYTFEANELVYDAPRLFFAGQTASFNIAVPSTAPAGQHRLRIRAVYEDPYNSEQFDACSDEFYGETQDYNIQVLTTGGAPLPLTLLSFKANATESKVALNWTTTQEQNVDRFVIEKSTTGQGFKEVAAVPAKGGTQAQYTWADVSPADGVNYYRLRMVDKNGDVRYSNVADVKWGSKAAAVRVVPNPVIQKTLGLQTSNMPAGVYNVVLMAADGQQVFNRQLKLDGSATSQVPLTGNITAGQYFLHVTGMQQSFKTTVVIK